MKTTIQKLREEVLMIKKATSAGTISFPELAKMHGSKIHKCRYNELDGIYCDTMAVVNGRTVITEQNLQYYPAKLRYFFAK